MAVEEKTKSVAKPRVEQLLDQYEQLLSGRKNFESTWQTLHDYFYVEAPDISKTVYPGTELDASYLWDATTLDAADSLASGFMNYLTPPSSKWFMLRHRNPLLTANKAIGDFLEDVTDEVNFALNRSNFYDQIFPSYKSSGVFGTSLLFEEEDIIDDIRFTNMPLKQVVIVEDARGRAAAYFLEFEYTAEQAESRWGRDVLSREIQEELTDRPGSSKKYQFVLYVAKRNVREIQKSDKRNLPIEALWMDKKAKISVEEGGYNEFPAMVHRFEKQPFLPWGFSPAMKALPFARMLNTIAKTTLRSMMKHTDPPTALPDNAFLAPLNLNPRAVNYYQASRMSGKEIFTFGNTGDPQIGMAGLEYYSNQVRSLMFNDAFLMFNNISKEMNNPEVAERINEKMTLLGPAVGRAISEVLNPVVQRTIGILYRRGKLPQVPDEMIMEPGYVIDFIGILAQAQRRSELNTLLAGLTVVGQMAQYAPDVLDKVDPDKVVNETWSITGAPVQVLRDDAEVEKIRETRAETMVKQREAMMMTEGAKAAKDAGAAVAGFAKAKESNDK